MRVAFYSYPSAFQNPGGGEVQLLKTKEALEALGVEVKLFDQWNDRLKDFDVFHVFGSVKDCAGIMQTAGNLGVKVALSTIFWSSFNRALHEGGTFGKRAELFSRHLLKLAFPLLPTGRRKTMSLADVLLPNSESEKKQVMRLFGISPDKIIPVPNGVDERFLSGDPEEFSRSHGMEDFILAVGRIEPRKNQKNLIMAVKGLKQKLVIVGNPVSDYMWYYDECRKEAGDNVVFLGGIDHESTMLTSAYAACSVFAAPGWFETPGLAALEAAGCGAGIAITKHGSTVDYFGDEARYFEPAAPESIRKAVMAALRITKAEKQVLRRRIKERFLWKNVAQETLKAYKSVS